jgi:hypothetical protein
VHPSASVAQLWKLHVDKSSDLDRPTTARRSTVPRLRCVSGSSTDVTSLGARTRSRADNSKTPFTMEAASRSSSETHVASAGPRTAWWLVPMMAGYNGSKNAWRQATCHPAQIPSR